jgi:hypothetical protein
MTHEHFSPEDPTFGEPQTQFQKDFNKEYVDALTKIRAEDNPADQASPIDTWLEDQQRAGAEHTAAILDALPFEPRLTENRQDFLDAQGVKKGEAFLFQPEVTRTDPSTGEAVIPLLFVQGMGGDSRLPKDLQSLAQVEQRMVIGLQYGQLTGSAELVEAENLDEPAPKIDVEQAGDLVQMLAITGIEKVDAAALSRGCNRLMIAMKQHPEFFQRAFLLHPPGLDERTSRQTHIAAAREQIARVTQGANEYMETTNEPSTLPKKRGLLRNWRSKRLEQKSVARADFATTLGEISPDIDVTVAGDINDRVFQVDRLRHTSERARVNFEETDMGGHVRLSDQRIPSVISRGLRKMEQLRAKEH